MIKPRRYTARGRRSGRNSLLSLLISITIIIIITIMNSSVIILIGGRAPPHAGLRRGELAPAVGLRRDRWPC